MMYNEECVKYSKSIPLLHILSENPPSFFNYFFFFLFFWDIEIHLLVIGVKGMTDN